MPSLATSIEKSGPSTQKEAPQFLDEGNEYLQCIDGAPASPPPYHAINPNTNIRFPVYEYEETSTVPPVYKPAVEQLTVVGVKCEWVTPYDPSPVDRWRNYIMEINSTQLNLYDIDPELTQGIKNYTSGAEEPQHTHLFSLSSKSCYQFNRADQERIAATISRNKSRYLHPNKLSKSFSLQCAKMGIPTDYTKRTFVLRLRCEQEQFMVNFAHVDDMIMWAMYLQIGISVALDLDLREYPSYRIVPRRRRRPRHGGKANAAMQRPSGPRRTQSAGKIPLGSLSSMTSSHHDEHAKSHSLAHPRIKPQKTASSGLLPSLHKRHSSSNSLPLATASSASSSRKSSIGEDSAHGIKSKFMHLFKAEEPPIARANSSSALGNQLAMTDLRPKSSPRKSAAAVDGLPRNGPTGLNSVQEDEEQEEEGNAVPCRKSAHLSALPHRPAQRPGTRRMASSPLLDRSMQSLGQANAHAQEERSRSGLNSQAPTPPNESISASGTPSRQLQREQQEVEKVRREHIDLEPADLRAGIHASVADDDEDEGEVDESDVGSGRRSRSGATSVYMEEGIFHDSDDDYVYTRGNSTTIRASSSTSGFFAMPHSFDGGKWNPPVKEPSRGRYIRDSLRCIKPLNDDEKWLGKVVFRPHKAPNFPTNNLPLSYGYSPWSSGAHSKVASWDGIDYRKTRNHYLKPYIVAATGFVKASTKPHNIYEEV
ncbi:uncharacterized protein ZBAI_09209 [Zygosaccharomyces bailii ISA1307]|nr:uncharacterized protein ZBAI_09209 [Zygosaccharomyces bailii ISA1307]